MLSGIFDTISSSINSVGDLLGWIFIGAAVLFFLRGSNGNSNKSSKGSGGSSTPAQ